MSLGSAAQLVYLWLWTLTVVNGARRDLRDRDRPAWGVWAALACYAFLAAGVFLASLPREPAWARPVWGVALPAALLGMLADLAADMRYFVRHPDPAIPEAERPKAFVLAAATTVVFEAPCLWWNLGLAHWLP